MFDLAPARFDSFRLTNPGRILEPRETGSVHRYSASLQMKMLPRSGNLLNFLLLAARREDSDTLFSSATCRSKAIPVDKGQTTFFDCCLKNGRRLKTGMIDSFRRRQRQRIHRRQNHDSQTAADLDRATLVTLPEPCELLRWRHSPAQRDSAPN